MIQIPDTIRPHLDMVRKHHFWILLGLVPLVVLPMVFLVRSRLAAEIDDARGQVESRLTALRSVEGIRPHPNEEWSGEIGKATTRVKQETLTEWRRFWDSQQPLRVWPASLGPDFVQRVTALKPNTKLPRPLLERYQNGVRAIVRTLPGRMGADETMVEGGPTGPRGPGAAAMMEPGMPRGRQAGPEKPAALVQWNPADQQRLYATFNWEKPPSTTQMLLAQEELWVYGVLADAIARVNRSSAAAYNAAIPLVDLLAVGYPAAEDNPGAVAGGRIVVPVAGAAAPGGEFMPPPDFAMPEGGAAGVAAVRPPHPRFSGGMEGGQPTGPGAQPPADAAASPDDLLRNWIYVDFTGKPLMAADLATSTDALLMHLVPFVIRAVVDERKLDAFLVDLATAPIPIDVRQVRINAGGGASTSGMPGGAAAPPVGRPHDITVELRGTVALATPPDRQLLGLEPESNAGDDAEGGDDPVEPGEQAVAEPAADDVSGEQR